MLEAAAAVAVSFFSCVGALPTPRTLWGANCLGAVRAFFLRSANTEEGSRKHVGFGALPLREWKVPRGLCGAGLRSDAVIAVFRLRHICKFKKGIRFQSILNVAKKFEN